MQCGIAEGSLFPQKQEMLSQYTRNAFSKNAYPFGAFPIKMNYDDWQVGFDAAWELDIWGLFRRGIEAAGASLDAQVAGFDAGMVMLQAEVAANYVQMRAAEKRIALTQKNADLQEKTLHLVELRYAKGLVTELDVQRAKANLAVTESLIPTFQINRRKAQNRLCILLGMPPRDLVATLGDTGRFRRRPPRRSSASPPIPALPTSAPPSATRRPNPRIGMAEADFYPHIAITGEIILESQYVSSLFKGDSLAGSIGPGFRWNILNYGRIANNVRAQDARFRQAVVEYQQAVLSANEEAENAMVSFLRERNRAKSLEAAATATERPPRSPCSNTKKGSSIINPCWTPSGIWSVSRMAWPKAAARSRWIWSPCTRRWAAGGKCVCSAAARRRRTSLRRAVTDGKATAARKRFEESTRSCPPCRLCGAEAVIKTGEVHFSTPGYYIMIQGRVPLLACKQCMSN